MDKRPIGMFDSGVGGLTVYKEIKKNIASEQIIYLGDTKRFPYGSKTKDTIIELTKKAIEFLIKQNVKAIVIACGTATSQALNEVKDLYDIPIIGIINDTVDYIDKQGYKKVGIMATRGTIQSKGWENALKEEIRDIDIQTKACPLLAPMAEEGWTNNEIARLTIKEYIKDFKDIEALVLGCTHYPLFYDIISEYLPNTDIINTGKPISEHIMKEFMTEDAITDEQASSKINENETVGLCEDKFYLTETECNFVNVAHSILGKEVKINDVDIFE